MFNSLKKRAPIGSNPLLKARLLERAAILMRGISHYNGKELDGNEQQELRSYEDALALLPADIREGAAKLCL